MKANFQHKSTETQDKLSVLPFINIVIGEKCSIFTTKNLLAQMPTILCIFKINESGMFFRETVGVHPFCKKTHCDQFLALSLPCTHMYAFRVPSSPFAYAISSIDTSVAFTFLVFHSFRTPFIELTLSDQ